MIAEEIKEKAGKKFRSGDWYVSELENALGPYQADASETDTDGISIGSMFFFSYGAKYPDKYEFWDVQPLAVALRLDKAGFLGCK